MALVTIVLSLISPPTVLKYARASEVVPVRVLPLITIFSWNLLRHFPFSESVQFTPTARAPVTVLFRI